jgi:hypothetical protein
MSLVKTSVDTHVHTKCPGATVVKEEKLVKHHDIEYTCDDVATLHQCSGCGYTSVFATNVKTHVRNKCKTATVLSGKRKLVFGDVPPPPTGNISTSSNTGIAVHTNLAPITQNNVNLNLVIVANSREEYDERLRIFYKVSKENGLIFEKGEFMPSAILEGLEKENPALDNKQFTNNSVVCLKTGKKTPVVQYAKDELVSIVSLMADIIEKFETPEGWSKEEAQTFLKQLIDVVIDKAQLSASKYVALGPPPHEDTPENFWRVHERLAELLGKDENREKETLYTKFFNAVGNTMIDRLSDQKVDRETFDRVQTAIKDIAEYLKTKKLSASRGRPSQTLMQ